MSWRHLIYLGVVSAVIYIGTQDYSSSWWGVALYGAATAAAMMFVWEMLKESWR